MVPPAGEKPKQAEEIVANPIQKAEEPKRSQMFESVDVPQTAPTLAVIHPSEPLILKRRAGSTHK